MKIKLKINNEFKSLNWQRHLQFKLLKKLIKKVYENNSYYRELMDKENISINDIRSLDDISKLPFTYKKNLIENYPYGFISCKQDDIVRIHASSGTSGKITSVPCTQNDLDVFKKSVARSYYLNGINNHSTFLNALCYGLFIGGLGAQAGAEYLGATVIPSGVGNTSRQVQFIQDYRVDTLSCTPSYALHLIDYIKENNINIDSLHLKRAFFAGEPCSEETFKYIEKELNIKALNVYGMSEITNIMVSCYNGRDLHIPTDSLYVEIINPKTGEILKEGERGEVVITTLLKTGQPLIRYRTGDISSISYKPCACGRLTPRLEPLLGRSDDMLIIRGINVFPIRIEKIITETPQLTNQYMINIFTKNNLDELTVEVELNKNLNDEETTMLQKELKTKLKSELGVRTEVSIFNKGHFNFEKDTKVHRINDTRKK